ncbi:bifunctional adenosylcobinamide kinase/adenosylcobinamide-phosphate guanylyltransferase [Jannaschia sp. W003]|uniref:bifunctional adenosylcobinamide kinase/adenosylcobinamide-phosphate guanylyltransferase n=1 Tax=Jannaschia sp. W003 TaxID=2867012 RepID=UPI0021A2ED6F|nr:bifunctional adenosylcobinamide kinase/adenosylcobinamide-phosphate guanylyltransferase [Jannaschia sp. W003]UWQ22205.1 bifunctional adenosylcobinamide kinase/adenosylcobinamide-phosphate guanylyltransferase [Jannaschia sp. W003]
MLALGHAASGKSAFAEAEAADWAAREGAPLAYVATARILDAEMEAKRAAHAARRGTGWVLHEAPEDLAGACAGLEGAVLVDCATMWLANLGERDWEAPAKAWIAAMRAAPGRFWVVSNDVGGGVVPANAMARRFQRAQGLLNQRLAAAADRVVLVTAGLPQVLK